MVVRIVLWQPWKTNSEFTMISIFFVSKIMLDYLQIHSFNTWLNSSYLHNEYTLNKVHLPEGHIHKNNSQKKLDYRTINFCQHGSNFHFFFCSQCKSTSFRIELWCVDATAAMTGLCECQWWNHFFQFVSLKNCLESFINRLTRFHYFKFQ